MSNDIPYPDEVPILPVRDTVVYPGVVVPISVGREKSLRLIQALQEPKLVGIITQRNIEQEDVTPENLHEFGTLVKVHHILQLPNDTTKLMIHGLERIRLMECIQEEPFLAGKVEIAPDIGLKDNQVEALMRTIVNQLRRYYELASGLSEELITVALNTDDPNRLAYLVGYNLPFKLTERQSLLEVDHPYLKLGRLSILLGREIEIHELGQRIQAEVQSSLGKSQRDYYLREQLHVIRKELGEEEDTSGEAERLRVRLNEAKLPEEAHKETERELLRLERIPPGSAEHPVIRGYIDWMLSLPWNTLTEDSRDILRAKEILDEDHYDLERIKQRILEYLSVYKFKAERQGDASIKGPILCLVGPPGVGKTSLGRSIARALNRSFTRMSLGGMRDEAEIRGHRRTYIGAIPGRIIQAISRCGSRNPVFMLDEIDKIGAADFRGDPTSAFLEVLDPEQNREFRDHYLDVAFDLSQVLFIATANTLDSIPPALRDRMEILQLSGYSEAEKLQIALRHLVPKQLKEHCLSGEELAFLEEGLQTIINQYTREAGVRSLEREIASVCRKAVKRLAEGNTGKLVIDGATAVGLLGKPRFYPENLESTEPGISKGLAWTEHGGEVLAIETARLQGSGQLRLTGQLGDVMKESAQAALGYLWSRSAYFGMTEEFFRNSDFHIHVPSGGVPKDGPSAGMAIALALLSLVTDSPIPPGIGFTGEITLKGKILPVGGIREKILAAKRLGLKTIVLPRANQADLEDIPADYVRDMQFILVDALDEALPHVLPLKPISSNRLSG